MAEIANLVVRYSADTKSAEAGADRVNSSIGKVTKAGAALAVAGGALLGGFFAKSIMAGASFESSMDGVAASLGGVDVAGGITTDQLSHLADVALDIGANTTVGANDAAVAMDLLAKGGVTYQQIMDGAALSAVQVSTATATGLDQTAQSMAAFTALFRDSNEQMGVSFADMSDIVVNSMNASGMSMSEFQTGMTNMAPLIAGTGLGFQDAAGLISYFNNQGMAAARVGTSLTAAYTNLTSPTNEMLQAQQALGIQVYDNNGIFRGIPAILGDVQEATKGMSEQDRDAAINALFGADARDVVGLALKDNKGALDEWIKGMGQSGTAEAAMATRMDNLKGDVENLKGAFETLTIRVGTAFLPALRGIVQGLTGGIEAVTRFTSAVMTLMSNGLNPIAAVFAALQKILFDMSGGSGVLKTLADAFSHLTILAIDMGEALADVMDAFQDLARGDFAGAWRELGEAAQTAWDAITQFVGVTLDWVLDTGIPAIKGWVVDNAGDVWSGIKSLAGWAWDGIGDVGSWVLNIGIPSAINGLTGIAARVRNEIEGHIDGLSGTSFEIALIAIDVLDAVANIQASQLQGWIQERIDEIGTFKAEVKEWQLIVQGDPDVEGDPGEKAHSKLDQIIRNLELAFPILAWTIETTRDPDIVGDPVKRANDTLQDMVRAAKLAVNNIDWVLGLVIPDINMPSSAALVAAVKAKIPSISVPSINWSLGLSLPDINLPTGDAIKAAIRVAGEAVGIPDWILDRVVGDASPTPAMEWGAPFGNAPRSGQASGVTGNVGGEQVTTLPNTGAGPGASSGAAAIAAQAKAAAQQVAAAMTQLAASVRSGVQQATAALNPLGAAFTATGARVTATTTQMSAQVRAQVTAMVAAARAQFTAFQASTTATMTAMAAQVQSVFAQMTANGTAQVNALRSAVQAGMSAMAAAGSSAMSQFANAVRSGFSQAAAAAQSGVNAIRGAVNSIGSLYGQGFSIGSSFGSGVAAGLYSMLGAVQAAASAIVAAAAQAAAAKAQIASPSKLMRDQIGVPLAQGVIVGLDSQRSNVASAFASMIPVDARLGRGYQPGGISGSGRYAAGGGQTVIVYQTVNQVVPEKLVTLMQQAKQGASAYQQQLPRSRDRQLGSTR